MATINNSSTPKVGLVILAGVSHVGEKSLAPSGTMRDGETDREMGYWKGNYYKTTRDKFSNAGGVFFPLEGSGIYGGSPTTTIPGSGVVGSAGDANCSHHDSAWVWDDDPAPGFWTTEGGACAVFKALGICDSIKPPITGDEYDGASGVGECVDAVGKLRYTAEGGYASWEEAGGLKCSIGKDHIQQRNLYVSKDAYLNLGSGINLCADYTVYAKVLPSGEPTDSIILAQHKNDPANIILGCDYDGRYYIRSDADKEGVSTAYYAKSANRFDSYRFPVHLVGTYGSHGTTGSTLRIYVNGNLEGESASFSRDTSSCQNTNILLGKRHVAYLERGFRGWYDELAVMGSGYSSADIKKFHDSIYRLGNFVEELGNPSAKATATITFSGAATVDEQITIIDSVGLSKTYTAKGSTTAASLQFINTDAAAAAAALKICIDHANGHNGSITVVNDGGGRLHLTQGTIGNAGNTTITENLTNVAVSNFTSGYGGAFDGQAFGGTSNFWATNELGTGAFDALDTEYAQLTIESGVDNTDVKGGAFALYNYNKSSGDCTGLVRTATKNAVSSVLSFRLADPPVNFFQLTGLSVDVWVENSTNHPSGADLYASISDPGSISGYNVNWSAGYKYVPSGQQRQITFTASTPDEVYGHTGGVSFRPRFKDHNLNLTVVYPKADFPYDAEFKIYSTRVRYSSLETFNSINTSLSGPVLFSKGAVAVAANSTMPLFLDADTAAARMNLFLKRETSSGMGETGAGLMLGKGSVVTNSTMNLFTQGGTIDTNMRLFLRTRESSYSINSMDMFVHGALVSYPYLYAKTDLYLLGQKGSDIPSTSMILSIPNVGIGKTSGRRFLFTEGTKPASSLNLFAKQNTQVTKSIPLLIAVSLERSASGIMNLYLNQRDLHGIGSLTGLPGITKNTNMNLFTTGFAKASGIMNLSMPNTIGKLPSGVLHLDIRGH